MEESVSSQARCSKASGQNGKPVQPEFHFTDLGNARRVITDHVQDLHYCYPWKKWLVWDGRRWCCAALAL